MKKLLLAGLAAGAWSSCAVAADLGGYAPPRQEPIYEPVRERNAFNWQGLYFGANAGYGWGNDNAASYNGDFGGNGNLNPSGWMGGGQIGYNAQFNWLVLGLEADLQGADISDSTALDSGGFTSVKTDIDWFSTLRGRIGYAAGPTLIYFTGGWAFADLDQSVSSPTASISKDEIASGYTVGGGLEWQFAPNWSLKTEYLYVDLGDQKLTGPSGTYTTDTDFHTVRAGVNFHF
jgi:outer membrane immunogenic protein